MTELTLESLAARIASLERTVAALNGVVPPSRDWRSVVGISEETEFSRQMLAEMEASREAERKVAALNGVVPPSRDWRSVVGMFEGSEFMKRVDAEVAALRAAEPDAGDGGAGE